MVCCTEHFIELSKGRDKEDLTTCSILPTMCSEGEDTEHNTTLHDMEVAMKRLKYNKSAAVPDSIKAEL